MEWSDHEILSQDVLEDGPGVYVDVNDDGRTKRYWLTPLQARVAAATLMEAADRFEETTER